MNFPFGAFLALVSLYPLSARNANETKNSIPKNAHATIINSDFACDGVIPIDASAFGFCKPAYPATINNQIINTMKPIHPTANNFGEILRPLFCTFVLMIGFCADEGVAGGVVALAVVGAGVLGDVGVTTDAGGAGAATGIGTEVAAGI